MKIQLFLLTLVVITAFQTLKAQDSHPKIIFKNDAGKILSIDEFNEAIKAQNTTHIVSEHKYGKDSTVYTLKKKSKEMLAEDSILNAKRNSLLQELVGTPAKDFSLATMINKPLGLSNLKGKVVVMNFWSTTCTPCIQEIPELNVLKDKFKKSRVDFIAVTRDSAEVIKGFLKKHPFNFAILLSANKLIESYGILLFLLPHLYLMHQERLF